MEPTSQKEPQSQSSTQCNPKNPKSPKRDREGNDTPAEGCDASNGDTGATVYLVPGKMKKIKLENKPEDFTCAICMETVISPAVLTCSHMFCIACIEDYAMQGGDACPMCRSYFAAESRFVVNKLVQQIVKGYFRHNEEYDNRIIEHNRKRFMNFALVGGRNRIQNL